MTLVQTSQINEITVDLDALAESQNMTTKELKDQLRLLGLSQVINEARRLNHREHFDKKTQTLPYPPIEDRHLIAATKALLS